jgi:hypothetical protein
MPLMEHFKVRDGIWLLALVTMAVLWYADRHVLTNEIAQLKKGREIQEVTVQNALRRLAELRDGK